MAIRLRQKDGNRKSGIWDYKCALKCEYWIFYLVILNKFLISSNPFKIWFNYKSRLAVGRLGIPDEIAKVVLFLYSDLASYVKLQNNLAASGIPGFLQSGPFSWFRLLLHMLFFPLICLILIINIRWSIPISFISIIHYALYNFKLHIRYFYYKILIKYNKIKNYKRKSNVVTCIY